MDFDCLMRINVDIQGPLTVDVVEHSTPSTFVGADMTVTETAEKLLMPSTLFYPANRTELCFPVR